MEITKPQILVYNTHIEIFPYIKDGLIRTGKTIPQEFIQPDGTITKQVQGFLPA